MEDEFDKLHTAFCRQNHALRSHREIRSQHGFLIRVLPWLIVEKTKT